MVLVQGRGWNHCLQFQTVGSRLDRSRGVAVSCVYREHRLEADGPRGRDEMVEAEEYVLGAP